MNLDRSRTDDAAAVGHAPVVRERAFYRARWQRALCWIVAGAAGVVGAVRLTAGDRPHGLLWLVIAGAWVVVAWASDQPYFAVAPDGVRLFPLFAREAPLYRWEAVRLEGGGRHLLVTDGRRWLRLDLRLVDEPARSEAAALIAAGTASRLRRLTGM